MAPPLSFNYWLPAGAAIKRSKLGTILSGTRHGWEDFTTTREALFSENDLILSSNNDMVVVRIPNVSGARSDRWQSIQFDFLQLKRVVGVKQNGTETQ